MNDIDLNLGSAGPVLIPNTRYVIGGGKQGIIYVVDHDNMGKLVFGLGRNNLCLKPSQPPPACPPLLEDSYPEKWGADHLLNDT